MNNENEIVDIITFAEDEKFLGIKLKPWQKLTLKIIYNKTKYNSDLIISDNENHMMIKDLDFDNLQQIQSKLNKTNTEFVLLWGRRTGKSLISSIIASYEVYLLLEKKNPQDFYCLEQESDIRIILNGMSENSSQDATICKLKNIVCNSPYFINKIDINSINDFSIRFITEFDKTMIENKNKQNGSIIITSKTNDLNNAIITINDDVSSLKETDINIKKYMDSYIANSMFGTHGKIISFSVPYITNDFIFFLYNRSFNYDQCLLLELSSDKFGILSDEFLNEELNRLKDKYEMIYGCRKKKNTIEKIVSNLDRE